MRSPLRLLSPVILVLLAPAVASAATISISISSSLGTVTGTLTEASLEARLAALRDSFEQPSPTLVSDGTGSGSLSLEVRDELPTPIFGVIETSNREETPEEETPSPEPSLPDLDGGASAAVQLIVGVPEPHALALLALAAIGLAARGRRPIG